MSVLTVGEDIQPVAPEPTETSSRPTAEAITGWFSSQAHDGGTDSGSEETAGRCEAMEPLILFIEGSSSVSSKHMGSLRR